MPQMRQLVLHDQLRRVRLRHVRGQIDCREKPGQARRFHAAGDINARPPAPAKQLPVMIQPNRKDQPRDKQPKPQQHTAAEPDQQHRRGHERRCCRLCRFLRLCYRLHRLLHRRLRQRHGLRRLLHSRRGLHRRFWLDLLHRCHRFFRRQHRQGDRRPRQAELQQHHQPQSIDHPLRHVLFEYCPYQQNRCDQRRNRQSISQHGVPSHQELTTVMYRAYHRSKRLSTDIGIITTGRAGGLHRPP